jgi:hypothetical protein
MEKFLGILNSRTTLGVLTIRTALGIFVVVWSLIGCQKLEPFPPQKYLSDEDLLRPYYEQHLQGISGRNFDSEQVSNKFLDPEMIAALEQLNTRLAQSETLPSPWQEAFERGQLKVITIASAARTPWHQHALSSQYKASAFSSMHSLGLAVDLEMNGKPFDIVRRADDPSVQACYSALVELMAECGLFFSEPIAVDANHVELMRYSRKSACFDESAWRDKNRDWWVGAVRYLEAIKSSRYEHRQIERLRGDIEKKLDGLYH